MWQQAESNVMLLAPLDCNGWTKNNETLEIFWDTAENTPKNMAEGEITDEQMWLQVRVQDRTMWLQEEG